MGNLTPTHDRLTRLRNAAATLDSTEDRYPYPDTGIFGREDHRRSDPFDWRNYVPLILAAEWDGYSEEIRLSVYLTAQKAMAHTVATDTMLEMLTLYQGDTVKEQEEGYRSLWSKKNFG